MNNAAVASPRRQLATILAAQLERTLGWLRLQPHMSLIEVNYNSLIESLTLARRAGQRIRRWAR